MEKSGKSEIHEIIQMKKTENPKFMKSYKWKNGKSEIHEIIQMEKRKIRNSLNRTKTEKTEKTEKPEKDENESENIVF